MKCAGSSDELEDMPLVEGKTSQQADLFKGVPDLSDHRTKQIAKLNIFGAIVIAINALGWAGAWVALAFLPMTVFSLCYVFYAWWIYRVSSTGRYHRAFGLMLAGLVVWLSIVVFVASGPGIGNSGSVHGFFLTLAVACFIVLDNTRHLIRYGLTCLMLLVFFAFHIPFVEFTPYLDVPHEQHMIASTITWISVALTTVALYVWLNLGGERYERKIKFSHKRLHHLFNRVHSDRMSDNFRHDGDVVATAIPDCSVLFVEVANFAELSERLDEITLLNQLDGLYGEFDDQVYDLNLDKIKTFDHSYLVASGVLARDDDHASKLLTLANRFLDVAAKYPELQVRIGLHSGAATAGLVKEQAFIYSLWGEAVHIARAIEQCGEIGKVNLSKRACQKAQQTQQCKRIQSLQIGGWGPIDVYSLES